MLRHTRRRALGLIAAVCAGTGLLPAVPRAFAQDEEEEPEEPSEPECYDSKKFGPWTAQASDASAGAGQRGVLALNPKACDLGLEFQVNTDFDARIFIEGSPEGTPLPEDFLVKPENRLIAKTADGTVVVDEALCGNCTDIYDDTVSIVLPLATAPLLREQDSVEIALRLRGKDEDCRFKIDCVTMRQALDWAAARRDALATERDDNKCISPEGCFITTACCGVLGLSDDCFELRTLRRYRDDVLAKQRGGADAIARYYGIAPRILAALSATPGKSEALLSVYARFVLPAALSTRLGLNTLTYRIYVRMLNALAAHAATAGARVEASRPPR